MLYEQVVTPSTLRLLRELSADEWLDSFCLVGGTALALQIGHRRSEDIDLFTQQDIDTSALNAHLLSRYAFACSFVEKNTLKGTIRDVKVDLITFPYKMVSPVVREGGLRLAGVGDIAAMKLSAIVQNGTRLKDFIDVAYLSCQMSLSAMIDCYARKFPNANPLIPVKAVAYFDDIYFGERIELVDAHFDWKKISGRIQEMLRSPETVFTTSPLAR